MKSLVVYESPNKFKSFSSIFEDMDVSFCYTQGRIYDLPPNSLGITEGASLQLEPINQDRLSFLEKKIAQHSTIYCLTDNDPEGEWIASHIKELCDKHNLDFLRVRIEEFTKKALYSALRSASSTLNENLVSLAVTRRVMDRVIGYHGNESKEAKRGRVLTPVINHIHQSAIRKQSTIAIHVNGIEVIVTGEDYRIQNLFEKIKRNPSEPLYSPEGVDSKIDLHNTMDYMMERSIFYNIEPEQAFNDLQRMYENGDISYTRTENKKYEVLNGQHKGIHAISHDIDNEDAEKSDGSGHSNIQLRTSLHLNSSRFDVKNYSPSDTMQNWCSREELTIQSIRSISRKRKSVHEIPRPLSLYFGTLTKKVTPECKVFEHSQKTTLLMLLHDLGLGTPSTFHTHVKKLSGLTRYGENRLELNTKGMRIALQTDELSLHLANLETTREVNELIFNNTLSIEDKCKKCLNVLRISDPSTSGFSLEN